jgi:hypothetical protein
MLVVDPLPKAILSSYKFKNEGILTLTEPGELSVLMSFFSICYLLSSAVPVFNSFVKMLID